ncbi:MAG TPA: peptide-methionine (S)-S-oxide reductase MsrA [Candidatus Baltobacteraceae bacterium]|jgi:peptide-methionine (S)-S-oxide reductase|nr:peptide-methionine (S)-S-oxide reductase MsrA [Candidatus Baltobacteraceae bacterium]
MSTEHATFAAGCFWGVEAAFRQLPGVLDAVSGYTGGHTDNPTYREVCSGRTGHAEAVDVTYDPATITYENLVEAFWKVHDPTQRNRQGPDVGSQYRSAIFTHTPEQERIADESRDRAQRSFQKPIATEIVAARAFWPAEDYHQRYAERNGIACHVTL